MPEFPPWSIVDDFLLFVWNGGSTLIEHCNDLRPCWTQRPNIYWRISIAVHCQPWHEHFALIGAGTTHFLWLQQCKHCYCWRVNLGHSFQQQIESYWQQLSAGGFMFIPNKPWSTLQSFVPKAGADQLQWAFLGLHFPSRQLVLKDWETLTIVKLNIILPWVTWPEDHIWSL